jgi:hypothetical protein
MGEPAIIQASSNDAAQDATANRAIRHVASTPSPHHIIPAGIVAFLYEHVDFMRAELFGGQVPTVVLSFDVTDQCATSNDAGQPTQTWRTSAHGECDARGLRILRLASREANM